MKTALSGVTVVDLSVNAPGPFAFADGERVRGILEGAGFVGVEVESVDEIMVLGGGGTLDDDDCVACALA